MALNLDSRITLQKLEVLCLVVELGSVKRAADQMYVSQPVVSAHLRVLQERLGGEKLLYRDGRRMRLTEAGQVAHRWAKEVLGRSHEVVREIDGLAHGVSGEAVVAAGMAAGSYILPPVLCGFRQRNPGARLTLHVGDTARALAQVESGLADFAIVAPDEPIEARSFTTDTIGVEHLVLVASPSDAQVGLEPTQNDLERFRYVCSPVGLGRRRMVDAAFRAIGVHERDVVIELGNAEAVKYATREGLGVSVLAESSIAHEVEVGLLRHVDIGVVRFPVPVLLVRRTAKRLSPLQDALVDAIRQTLTRRDAQHGAPATLAVVA